MVSSATADRLNRANATDFRNARSRRIMGPSVGLKPFKGNGI